MINECLDDIRDMLEKHITGIKDINPSHDIIDSLTAAKLKELSDNALNEVLELEKALNAKLNRLLDDIKTLYTHQQDEIESILKFQSELADGVKSMREQIAETIKKAQTGIDKIGDYEDKLVKIAAQFQETALLQWGKAIVLDFADKPKNSYGLYGGH